MVADGRPSGEDDGQDIRQDNDAGELALEETSQRIFQETGFQSAAAKVDLVGFCTECREQRLAEIRAQFQGSKP